MGSPLPSFVLSVAIVVVTVVVVGVKFAAVAESAAAVGCFAHVAAAARVARELTMAKAQASRPELTR